MTRALRSFYGFVALRWFRLTGALWILYLLHVGWTLGQVGLAEAAYHVVSFTSDVPTGAFADRFGRRTSVVTGLGLAAVLDIVLYLVAPHHVLAGSVVLGLSALSWTFIGGADAALLHSLSEKTPAGSAGYARLYGRMDAIGLLSGAVAAVLGGYLAVRHGWIWPYAGEAAAMALAIPLVLRVPRMARSAPSASPPAAALLAQVRETVRTVRRGSALAGLVLFGAVLGIVATSNHLYAQATLVDKGLGVFGATLVIGGADLLSAAASAFSHRFGRRLRALGLLAVVLAFSVWGVGAAAGLWAVAAYALTAAASGGTDVLFVTELNRRAPEHLRAGILSVPNSLFSLGMIAIFPLSGFLMPRFGLGLVYGGWGLFLLAALALWSARPGGAGSLLGGGRQPETDRTLASPAPRPSG